MWVLGVLFKIVRYALVSYTYRKEVLSVVCGGLSNGTEEPNKFPFFFSC